jgi:membrane fusion protein (multidrug efflux system)
MRRPGRARVVVVAASCLVALVACEPEPAGQSPMGGGGAPPEVGVVTLEPQRTVLTVELPGRTRPYAVSEVRPQVSGILEKRLFIEGSRVEAGQALYQIDDTRYEAAVDSAEAQLASAKAALATAKLRAERYASLRKDKSISQQDYDDAQTALQQAEADVAQQEASLEIARINLGYTRITAPIAGRIGRSFLTQGALVTANQEDALATIQTLDPVYVDINQSSSEVASLRRAAGNGRASAEEITARVTLILEDGTPYTHEGTLQFSEVVVDPTTGSVTLRAEFPNPDAVLLPGMFVRATVVTAVVGDALLVPQRGVSRDRRGNATALIVDDDGMVRLRTLTVTRTVGSSWLVTSGLEAGDRVIVEGLQFVRAGQPARPVPFTGDDAGVDSSAGAPTAS